MEAMLTTIDVYLARVMPGLVLGVMMLIIARREPKLRIVCYVALFILLRDAMTPLGLWSFGDQGFFWIRLYDNPFFLIFFGITCLALVLALYFFDQENRSLIQWLRGPWQRGLLWGALGALVVVAPFVVVYRYVPVSTRGGVVAPGIMSAMLVFALLGNLLEETLFRGYVYGQLSRNIAPLSAALASGVIFSFCHIYLATTVTNVGYPLLVFTLWEGVIAGVVGSKCGVLSSSLTHGGAIFLLSSGLF
jgi:membrane protease YdiL (CAAX protease family)